MGQIRRQFLQIDDHHGFQWYIRSSNNVLDTTSADSAVPVESSGSKGGAVSDGGLIAGVVGKLFNFYPRAHYLHRYMIERVFSKA